MPIRSAAVRPLRGSAGPPFPITDALITLVAAGIVLAVTGAVEGTATQAQSPGRLFPSARSTGPATGTRRSPSAADTWPGPFVGTPAARTRTAAVPVVQQTQFNGSSGSVNGEPAPPDPALGPPTGSPSGVQPGPTPLPETGPVLIRHHRRRLSDTSWFFIEPPPPPREIRQHDLITIVVDEKSEVIMNQRFNRQKNALLKAELKEFMRIGPTGNLENAALNGPTIDAQVQGNLRTTGQLTDQEGIKYRIAATVTDILPNGVLQLEASKTIRTEDDESVYRLTGLLRAEDVGPDNTASSENIANLRIVKEQSGRVYDSTKRNWGYRLYDLFFPF